MTIFLGAAIIGAGIGTLAAVAFFLIFLAVAFIVFKLLKRTVKMAFRIMIVAVILTVAVAGSVALWALGKGNSERPRPPAQKNR
jgi:phosphoglycerol transferase MdoB-like AlkP superfamily enzyme